MNSLSYNFFKTLNNFRKEHNEFSPSEKFHYISVYWNME